MLTRKPLLPLNAILNQLSRAPDNRFQLRDCSTGVGTTTITFLIRDRLDGTVAIGTRIFNDNTRFENVDDFVDELWAGPVFDASSCSGLMAD